MAFANLFTSLSVVSEDVKSPGEAAFLRSQRGEDGKSIARKRKPKARRSGPNRKKQRYQDNKMDSFNATSFENTDIKAVRSNMHNTSNGHASTGFTTENNHTGAFPKGRNYTQQKCNESRQQQETVKTKRGQKNLRQRKDQRKNPNGDGRHHTRENLRSSGKVWKRKDDTRVSKNAQVKFPRPMTQEFKDQNALSVDGQLLCRHHLWGRCIKGDDCQLKHIQGYNDLIKEVCKFYIQGFCMKGESCPYMHKSFPCKFFHGKGKCSQGADCRFSHEPLNEVTRKLLDELATKAEQDTSEQRAKTNEAEMTAANTASEVLIQPLMPNFYNSEQTNAEEEALPCQDDELSTNMEQTCPTQTQAHSPSTESVQDGPVCYSVEAVLGRQHFKPFPSFTTRLDQHFCSSESTSSSVDQSDVPYSVDAVLRSYKSSENSTLGYTPFPPAAQTECEDMADVSPYQVRAGLPSQTCLDPALVSGDRPNPAGEIPEYSKPDPSVSDQVQLGLLHLPSTSSKSQREMEEVTHLADVTCSLSTKGERNLPFVKGRSLTCTPKHTPQLRPHVSGQTSVTQASVRPVGSATGLSESDCGVAVKAEPANSSDETSDSESSVRRFPPCISKDRRVPTAAKPDQTATRSFSDLFAAPLLPAPVPSQPQEGSASCSQQPNHSVDASHFTDSRQRASDLEMPPRYQVKTEETSQRPLSPKLPTSSKNVNKSFDQREERLVAPTCILRDSLSDASSRPASCAAATENSVLRTLFLCLSPYQQDGEQQHRLQPGDLSEMEKHKGNTESVQPKNRRKRTGKQKLKTRQPSPEKPAAHSIQPQLFFQTPRLSSEASGGSALCSPATFKPLRSSGTQGSPTSAVPPVAQCHTQAKLRRATEGGKPVDGNKVVAPLKDLFKTLDTAVFHFGR